MKSSLLNLAVAIAVTNSVFCSVTAQTAFADSPKLTVATTKLFAHKARLRLSQGKTVLEYLDPASNQQNWVEFGNVQIYPAGTYLFHWGPPSDVATWSTKGIHEQDIRKAITSVDNADVVGGGFYLSLSPVDSSNYGEKLLASRSGHTFTVLYFSKNLEDADPRDARYSTDTQSFFDPSTKIEIPASVLADAGIDGIQYKATWLVAISARTLDHLTEGNWKVFESYSKSAGFNLAEFLLYQLKYPLSPEIISTKSFQDAFPFITKYLNGENISDKEFMDLATLTISKRSAAEIQGPAALAKFGDRWANLLKAYQKQVRDLLGF